MPYVITATLDITDEQPPDIVSRTAVATLDEAREIIAQNIDDLDPGLIAQVKIAESGGTIGPLPDGTVIEVRPVDWMDFERMVVPGPVAATIPITTFDSDEYRDGLLRGFNDAA